ncbi:MAG: hypothetical protein WCI73_04510 [Phycisphaerae bacterium]
METPLVISGVIPSLAQVADFGPPRSEIGIGGLMPWCGKMYVLNYVSHRRHTGTGTSLRVIDENLRMEIVPETRGIDGTYANRMIHAKSSQLIIGPHVIDTSHNIRTVKELTEIRLTGTALHLTNPDLVYMLGMEGELFELNVNTLACVLIKDLQKELSTECEGHVHFKDCYCCFGRLVVCSNDYFEEDFKGQRQQGRLAEWDGQGPWRILERKPFVCIHGRTDFTDTIFATGWDRASAILKVFTNHNQTWTTYRLPKASHTFDHKWQTEWPRIRETEHERFLMDHHGMFYELSPWAYEGRVWGIRPISTHLWVIPDFCTFRGLLVLGSDNASSMQNLLTAEPQSGLWFGKTDDLWNFGKPAGWGGPWWETPVIADAASDPYLMTGFDKKCLHLTHQAMSSVAFDVEVDFMGHGRWSRYATFEVAAGGYMHHEFPSGFSAHWLRIIPHANCVATAQLHYT